MTDNERELIESYYGALDNLGPETRGSLRRGLQLTAPKFPAWVIQDPGLEIGYKGYANSQPLKGFKGIDLDTPDYDRLMLPFPNSTFQTVYASHVLEHCTSPHLQIKEWFRVLRQEGYLFITIPHIELYERKQYLPSKWNADHKRFYRPGDLLLMIEQALGIGNYRLELLRDNAHNYNYDLLFDQHPKGCYEIECVVRKIKPHKWCEDAR